MPRFKALDLLTSNAFITKLYTFLKYVCLFKLIASDMFVTYYYYANVQMCELESFFFFNITHLLKKSTIIFNINSFFALALFKILDNRRNNSYGIYSLSPADKCIIMNMMFYPNQNSEGELELPHM